jgi:hypothetical protein
MKKSSSSGVSPGTFLNEKYGSAPYRDASSGQSDDKAVSFLRISPGAKVGSLTVAESTDKRKNRYTVWRCRCDCGGEILLDTRCLQRGTVTDCGCRTKVTPNQRDITGQRFGMLTAVYPTKERRFSGSAVWHCVCDCGGEVDAPLCQLTAGYRKSCGCLSHPSLKDYIGERFHMLTVLAYAGKENGQHMWRCRCDCGNATVVRQSYLQSGKTKSCGCLQGEQLVANMRLCCGTSVTRLEALRSGTISSNKSGCTGVYYSKARKRWCAQLTFRGKTYYLGSFREKEDAVAARKKGEEVYDDFLNWYYSTHPGEKADPGANDKALA